MSALGTKRTSSSLTVGAISFDYNMGGCRACPTIYVAEFLSSAGIDGAPLAHTSVSYPDAGVPSFLGWIGAPGEVLQQVVLTPRATGIIVDNIRAFAASEVPEPSTLSLIGLGLLGLGAMKRRRGGSS